MTAPQSLAQFHFDKEKSGKILRKWADESGLTRQELSDITGIPLNTLNNSLYGKVQDLTVDRTFKIATATGHCICEYIKLQLENESIDFADKVHVLRDPALVKQKAFDTVIIDDHHTINEAAPDHLLDRFRLDAGQPETMRFDTAWGMYIVHLKKTTGAQNYMNYESIGRCWLLPALGAKRLQKIHLADIQAIVNKAADMGRSAVTCQNIKDKFFSFYLFAFDNNNIAL